MLTPRADSVIILPIDKYGMHFSSLKYLTLKENKCDKNTRKHFPDVNMMMIITGSTQV